MEAPNHPSATNASGGPGSPTRRIGHYQFGDLLGTGGSGKVYRGRHLQLDREVAIKCVPVGDLTTMERLAGEQRVLDRLRHPHIVALYDVHFEEGYVYFVMEYAPGDTLGQALRRAPLTVERTMEVAEQLLSGLAHAHRAGIVHRDIKPDNVLLTPSGAKIVDFGIARVLGESRLTADGSLVGSAPYIAPELWEGHEATPASDVYACGLTLYEALAGVPAVHPEDRRFAVYANIHLSKDVRDVRDARTDVPPALADLIRIATSRAERARYPDAPAMLAALQACRAGAPAPSAPLTTGDLPARRLSPPSRPESHPDRHAAPTQPLWLGALAGGVVLLFAAVLATGAAAWRLFAPRPATEATPAVASVPPIPSVSPEPAPPVSTPPATQPPALTPPASSPPAPARPAPSPSAPVVASPAPLPPAGPAEELAPAVAAAPKAAPPPPSPTKVRLGLAEGVANVFIQVDGGSPTPAPTTVSLLPGTHSVRWTRKDAELLTCSLRVGTAPLSVTVDPLSGACP